MKKIINGVIAIVICVSMVSCGANNTSSVSEIEETACNHDWDLSQDRPVCKLCSENRDGTTDEALKYLWEDDISVEGVTVTMQNTTDSITMILTFPQAGGNKMSSVVDMVKGIYQKQGYLPSSVVSSVDNFYDFYFSEPVISFAQDSYKYFDKYCGDNLNEFHAEIYYDTELIGEYTNGTETYNFYNDELKEYGYHHN